MMELFLYILVIVGLVLLIAFIVLLAVFLARRRKDKKNKEEPTASSGISAGDLSDFQRNITEAVTTAVTQANQSMGEKIDKSNRDINETLGSVKVSIQSVTDAQKQLDGLSSNILNLQKILDNNQTRGQYGEYQLETMLENVFGKDSPLYSMQYDLDLGEGKKIRPDSVVFLNNDLVLCIDSKFPYQAYQRYIDAVSESDKKKELKSFISDVKSRIDEIARKYIIEGKTYPSAIMFIPNDGIYAFISSDVPELLDYAYTKHVSFASPSIFIPVLASIRMVKLEEIRNDNAHQLTIEISKLSNEFKEFNDDWTPVSRSIGGLKTNRDSLDSSIKKLNDHFKKIEESNLAISSDEENGPEIGLDERAEE